MDKALFDEELARIAAVVPKPWDAAEAQARVVLVGELWRQFAHLDGFVWHQVITWLVEHHNRRDLRPRDFSDAVESVYRRQPNGPPQHKPPTEVEKSEYLRMAEADAVRLTPHGAKLALSYLRQAKIKPPTDLRRLLVEIAGGEDSYVEPKPITKNAKETEGEFEKRKQIEIKRLGVLMKPEMQERIKEARKRMGLDPDALDDGLQRAANDGGEA